MKNTAICPKCASKDVFCVPGGRSAPEDNVYIGWLWRTVPVDRYICGSCGFSEEWIQNGDDIERIRRSVT